MRRAANLLIVRSGSGIDDASFRRLLRARDLLASCHEQPLRLDDAAREACLSPFHFLRTFTHAFGETPHEFLTRLRVEKARELLARTQMPVTDICMSLGYSSLGSFSVRFQTLVGESPSEFRRRVRRVFPAPAMAWARFIPACYLMRLGVTPR